MENNTRKNLIDSAFSEIYSNGYQGASLTTILKNAKVHKGSMYHFFENKKDMALVCIKEKIYERFVQRYSLILALESGYLEAFINGLKDTSQRDFNKGCPIANIVQEMSNIDEDFKVLMEEIYQSFRKNIKDILDISIQKNEMKACDTTKLALYIASTLEGAILSAKATGNIQDYVDVVDILSSYIMSFKKS
ncbi:TetR family transcriptional regulator [Arcobacter suis]|uniref:Transcriptional regulator, TetR/AcrR family n=1 Tax=Arcobacter suis CECT 7833 TaxID=663365 RepID=A0AAD0WQN9_9BACT|nr:TetR/AcrR family transcriptional regulator [Arcobacter suis]AXX89985.1 transcriptional regulator, TetR/AcrR family [Arcobacter suis CECT 7833]RWS47120.1 TetR family transcriptional regulator [Arcobacter suis]